MRDIIQKNDQLRKQRFQRNWRLQDVADKLGTTVNTVKRWERGSQQPSAYYRAKLCELFGISLQELGLEGPLPLSLPDERTEEVEEAKTVLSEEVTIWTVPYARNPHFTGRNDLLNQLKQQLNPRRTSQAGTIHRVALTQAQAVTGLGGIGKTQVAVEYAYRAFAQGCYTHTIWIAAASEEAILTSFSALAEQFPTVSSREETDQHKVAAAVITGWRGVSSPGCLFLTTQMILLSSHLICLNGATEVFCSRRGRARSVRLRPLSKSKPWGCWKGYSSCCVEHNSLP